MNITILTTHQPPGTRKLMKSYNFIYFVQLNKSGFLELVSKTWLSQSKRATSVTISISDCTLFSVLIKR